MPTEPSTPADDPFGLELRSERRENILVVNCGSSSLKYSFYDTGDSSRRAHGEIERIGLEGCRHEYEGPAGEFTEELPSGDFEAAFAAMTSALGSRERGVLTSAKEITLVVHRVVHGGRRFHEATIVDDAVLASIDELSPLAPLHNPAGVAGIRAMRRLLPGVPHVAVFDTAFHRTLPVPASLYGLPYEYYEDKGIRRYGFHGTSHAYVGLRAAGFLGRSPADLDLVSCHLGNGASLCAIQRGRSVDTTMGFTPAEGLLMGTRCGDIDAGVVTYLERTEGLTPDQIEELLNRKSGLLGLSGVSSDMREVSVSADGGNERSKLAIETFCYRIRKAIGAYVAALGGLDALIFTGGIGQGSDRVRALSLEGLECMGISFDPVRNREARGFDGICVISPDDSKVKVLIVPTDEERMMAREALRAVRR